MGRLFPLLGLLACNKAVTIASEAPGCTDYDPNDPPASEIFVEQQGGDVYIRHEGAFAACNGVFKPDVVQEGQTIEIYEVWLRNDTIDECESCFVPTVIFKDAARGRYEVSWFVEGVDIPLDTVSFDVD